MTVVASSTPIFQRRRQVRRRDDVTPSWRAEFCHDLRDPASAIMLLAATTEPDRDPPETVRARLRQIVAQAHWLATLLDHGLEGEWPRPLDVGSLVDDCLVQVNLIGPATVRAEIQQAGLSVEAPPIGLRRALANVVGNAVRAAGRDGHVMVSVREGDEDTVVVEVVDDGPGFGRIPTTHGLGLQIATDVLDSLGGTLDVSAPPDGGCCVRLTIPRFEDEDGAN
jgi:signal transduction histidine kinase